MSSHPIGAGSPMPPPEPNPWPDADTADNSAQMMAAVRAGAIALVLLAILAVIVFF